MIEKIAKALAGLGLGILLCLACVTMLDGLMRSLMNSPIDIVREIGDLVAAFSVACCLPMSLLKRSNITLRVFKNFGMPRLHRGVEAGANLLVLVIVAAIAWEFFSFAQKMNHAGEVTWMMNIPKAPFWYGVSVVLAFGVLAQLRVLRDAMFGPLAALGAEKLQ
jgi:TRAP-type C4-dicarboxylate transport system permease small subunit